MSINEIRSKCHDKLNVALETFNQHDKDLLSLKYSNTDAECTDIKDVKLHEICIAHKIAEYLQQEINKVNKDTQHVFHNLKVDIEYNKNIQDDKTFMNSNAEKKRCRPDIVVHQRRSVTKNIMVIEIKKSGTEMDYQNDFAKLTYLTSQGPNGSAPYAIGFFLLIQDHGVTIHSSFIDGTKRLFSE